MALQSFNEVLRAAISDIEEHGFDSPDRVNKWIEELGRAAGEGGAITAEQLKRSLGAIYRREVDLGGLSRRLKMPSWRVNQLAPKLRLELDRKILAASELIRLNRDEMMAKTIRRFSGWVTSIPAGGSEAVDRKDVADNAKRALKALPYEERRVMIDQAAKFKSSLDRITATDSGAIAGMWRIFNGSGYANRPDHKERENQIYLIRDSWAIKNGLLKTAGAMFTDEITQPGEEVYCQCRYKYIFNLRDLSDELLTAKGRESIGRK
jgi:hypothetical protein